MQLGRQDSKYHKTKIVGLRLEDNVERVSIDHRFDESIVVFVTVFASKIVVLMLEDNVEGVAIDRRFDEAIVVFVPVFVSVVVLHGWFMFLVSPAWFCVLSDAWRQTAN